MLFNWFNALHGWGIADYSHREIWIIFIIKSAEAVITRPPAASYAAPIDLSVQANIGMGNQCGMYNPAISITNTLNDLADSVNNLTESVIANATGSLAEMPMYFLALANPTLYNLLNNSLISAHTIIDASVKSCQETKNQIAQGKNPYRGLGDTLHRGFLESNIYP